MEKWQLLAGLGTLLLLIGGVPAAIGTTSTGLFILYCIVALAGAAVLAQAKRLRDAG